MRSSILLLAFSAAILGGCSTSYKTGQTPDDVYYSPERQHDEYVQTKNNDDKKYQGDDEYYDDRYLHMKVHNRSMWSDLDDWYYYNRRYTYGYYNCWCSNPWTPATYWNYYYNPYSSHGIVMNPRNTAYNQPRVFNLNTYNNNQIMNNGYVNPKGTVNNNNNNNSSRPARIFGTNNTNSNSNSNSNVGNTLRNIFGGSNNNNNSSSSSSSHSSSSTPSSSSGSSGSSSGSSAPVRKF